MEGESLFNDGTALVLVSLAANVVATGHFDLASTTRALLLAIVGGARDRRGLRRGGRRDAPADARSPHRHPRVDRPRLRDVAHRRAHPRFARHRGGRRRASSSAARRGGRSSRRASSRCRASGRSAGFGVNVLLFLLVGMQIDARMPDHGGGDRSSSRSSRSTPGAPSRSTAASPCCARCGGTWSRCAGST